MKRLFISIPLPDDLIRALVDWQESYMNLRGVRWTVAENLHITLAFLGDIEEGRISELSGKLGGLLGNFKSFEIELGGVELAPSGRRPRMIWLRFIISKEYVELADSIWTVAGKFVEPEILSNRKAPRAHVTLARFRQPVYINNLKGLDVDKKVFRVERVELMESELTAERPYYIVLKDFKL